jgi:hypothetical protein
MVLPMDIAASGGTEAVRVAVRVRDLAPKERLEGCMSCIEVDSQTGSVNVGDERAFHFEHAFGPHSSQETVYREAVAPLLDASLKGMNVTVLAYGKPPVVSSPLPCVYSSFYSCVPLRATHEDGRTELHP